MFRRDANHGLLEWALVITACWDWQKKSKNLTSLLAEFWLLPCPIRVANAPVPSSIGVNQCNLGLNKMLLVTL